MASPISLEEFAKIDLRIGKICEVKLHPNADRLYVLKVKVGDEERTLVAGLKQYYSPEELKGKKVLMLVNLEPKEIRGIKSEGMVLVAEDGETISLLVPERDVKSGAKIR